MAGDVLVDLGGHIVGEIVRQAADDGRGGGGIPSLEAADSEHGSHRASAWRRLAIALTRDCAQVGTGPLTSGYDGSRATVMTFVPPKDGWMNLPAVRRPDEG